MLYADNTIARYIAHVIGSKHYQQLVDTVHRRLTARTGERVIMNLFGLLSQFPKRRWIMFGRGAVPST